VDDVVVVQVSRLEAFKGQHVLVRALSTLQHVPRWTCWIVGGAQRPGDLKYLDTLRLLSRDLGISDRIRFTGERDDIPTVLRAADVYCQPNLQPEGFGLTFVEALAAGLPVVTSGIGGACEIVTESCGTMTEPGDDVALADALRRLIVDTEFRARRGVDARKRPDELCNPSLQMRRIQAVLSSAATRPHVDGARTVNAK
jgi:glycosyltransferase involved in cell wall biosynthesis